MRANVGVMPDGSATNCSKCAGPRVVKEYKNGRRVAYCSPCAVQSMKNWRYKITTAEYALLIMNADGKCEICLVQFSTEVPPHVDHCHDTGRVRGVLCQQCNLAIGYVKDDVSLLLKAADYLVKTDDVIGVCDARNC